MLRQNDVPLVNHRRQPVVLKFWWIHFFE